MTNAPKILSLLILALIAGCTKTPRPGPAAARFWEEALAAEFGKAYERFSFNDRSVKSREEFVQGLAFNANDSSVFRVSTKITSFRIGDPQTAGDTARIPVTITVPEALAEKYRGFLWKVTREIPADSGHVPKMVTLEGWNRLVLEENAWFVFGDWETQRRIEGELAQQRVDYLSKLKIRNVKVREDQDVRKYYLSFDLVNSGDRSLKFVEVMVTCLNRENRACRVLNENPVSAKTRPLNPGEKRRVRLDLTTTPVEWTMRTEVKVVDCVFKE
jgi:hypothetical protein